MGESLGRWEGEYAKDGSVDLKGNPVLRSKRGGWTACMFIVVYEVFERMAYYGISTNLLLYLINKLHQGTVEAANNVTNWVGTVFLMPILGAYLADAHLGRYRTFVLASAIYLSGMLLLTLAVSVPPLKPSRCTANCQPASTLQLGAFFGGLYIIALGNGGTKPNISTIGADQFDDFDQKERAHKLSFFNWWMFSIFLGTLFANTVLVYLQDNVGWTLGQVPSINESFTDGHGSQVDHKAMGESLGRWEGEYAKDGSVDLKGNPVLRSKRGGWTACLFIVAYEVFERMAYYGISSNLLLYLINKLHQGTVEAANNVTNWVGTVFLMPILGAYLADAHLGRYRTFVLASAIYLSGMLLLTLAVSVPPLKPSRCTANCQPASTLQLGAFFGGLYILALGNGGTKPNISTIGADQFDDFDQKERAHKLSFFNWWMFSIFLGTLFANTVLVYLQDNVGWTLGYGLPTLGLVISVLIFLAGTPFYRHKLPQGSAFTKMARVIVAASRKWRVTIPNDPKELHELDIEVYKEKKKFRIDSTSSLRFLNKAAVKAGPSAGGLLCTVTEVEETKQIIRMIPILAAMIIPCTMIAQTHTLFIKQGTTLNRRIGPHFEIPPASLTAFVTLSMLVSVVLYDLHFVRIMKRWTGNPRGIAMLQRIGIGLLLQIMTMLIASLNEKRRLSVARSHGLVENGKQVPLTIFILLPQFVLMGVADAFLVVGKMEFFYDQAPESMKSLGTSYPLTAVGVGNFLSSFLLSTVSRITVKKGKGWVLNNLNASHLDYYYGFLCILALLNFIFFLFVSRIYTYKAEVFESVDVFNEDQGTTQDVQQSTV